MFQVAVKSCATTRTDCWCRQGTAARLADALRTLIKDPELRISMGKKGRAFAESELSLEKVINENFKLYEKLLGS